MTHSKHTPGPWVASIRKEYNGRFQIKSFAKYEHAAFVVAECPKWDDKEDKSNANLIAAAPEMYEELVRLRDTLNRSGWGTDHTDKILAKARGES